MLDSILTGASGSLDVAQMLICMGVSLGLGIVIALVYMYRNVYSKNFLITLALLPAIVQAVILLVNGNLGVGVAVMGAFSLVRFRSIPGGAKEIACIFFAMAVGLATGMGFIGYAALFTAGISVMMLFYSTIRFGEGNASLRTLKIVIPEDLDYTELFDDLFKEFTQKATLEQVRTTNLGSLYELKYTITLKDIKREKEMIDKIRQRNGNLNIGCSRVSTGKEEL